MRLPLIFVAPLLLHGGCGRKNPVTEVSLSQSGVELIETTESFSENRHTFVFKAGDELELVAKNSLGNDCYSSPAAVAGQLVMRVCVGNGGDRREQLVTLASAEATPVVASIGDRASYN